MSEANARQVPPGEPRPILPFLAPFYDVVRDLSYALTRFTLGGLLLYHALTSGKLTGAVTVTGFAAGLAKRGLEPAVPLAYFVFFTETVGAVLLIVGLFTRFAAGAIAIELAVITFAVYWPNGFHFAQTPGGGAELPFLWGLMVFFVALRGGGPYSLDRKIGWEL
ncbi:MAG: DoxX family protein [Hyphomicrobiales bacterium]|nr:DoxX family protein [Alphaproteobacteria bacterium]